MNLNFHWVRNPRLFRMAFCAAVRSDLPPCRIRVVTDLLDYRPVVDIVNEYGRGLDVEVVHSADPSPTLQPPYVAQAGNVLVARHTYRALIRAAETAGAAVPELFRIPPSALTPTAANLSDRHFAESIKRPELERADSHMLARWKINAEPAVIGSALVLESTLPTAQYARTVWPELVDYRIHETKVVYRGN